MVKRILVLLSALLLSVTAIGQDREESAYATIFRGKLPGVYPYKFNGTYFWEQKAFQRGNVMYNGKLYRDVSLNLDAHEGELQVRPLEKSSPVVVFRDQVAWFTMGPDLFVNLQYLGWKEAPAGYFMVIRDGETPLLMTRSKVLRFDGTGGQMMRKGTEDFRSDVYNFFDEKDTYYALEKGALKKISKRNLNRRLQAPAGEPSLGIDKVTWHSHSVAAPTGVVAEPDLPGTGIGLPDGYFAERKKDTVSVQYVDNPLLASYRNKVYTVGDPSLDKGKAVKTVRGIVREAETGEPMYGVVIFDDATKTYTRTNRNGEYRINLPGGENILNFSSEGKEELALRVQVHSDGGLNVMMTEKVTMLKEAVVSAESMAQHRNTEMGVEKVSVKTVNKIPSAFGEGDIIKAVLTLPGIKTVGEASGGFNVRGGSADQNLILFNGNTIYNPSHLFGIFSAFNPDIVDNIELYKSSIPAEYGGRVSSVLNVGSKDGDMQKWKGSAGIGILTSRIHVEGPLNKGKTSIIAGARTSYSDWILKRLPKESAYAGGSAGFTDANLGIAHRMDDDNSLHAYVYYATDRFSFGGDTTFRYGNLNASLAWKHRTEEGSLKVSGGYDQYSNLVGAHQWAGGAYDLQTYIRQAFLRADRKRTLTDEHELSWGVDVTGYALDPGIMTHFGAESHVLDRRLDRELALEPAVYAADTWKPTEELSMEAGARLTAFYAQTGKKLYAMPDIRLAFKYSPTENLSFKAGLNSLSQNIHLISNTSAVSPMDTWKLSDGLIKPTWGWQAATGAYWTELNTGIDFTLETYFKQTYRALDFLPGATLSMNPNLAEELVPVKGRAYGVELMARKTTGKITGWASYSYSRARQKEMGDRGNEAIAHGHWYNAPYDKPHEFKLVTNLALTHRYSFSLNVDYSTGRPVTVPIGIYYYAGTYRMAYSERNAYRIPDYFRADLAFNIDPGHYLKAIYHTTITLGVYNITGRKNPYSVFFKTSPYGLSKGYMLSVFATQIPYININLLF
ncbi:MAG: carboxypeptidase-like regulatory domain-containing protein [Bacteroidales bacterium]|nr:carboxypeptidase-like regulatory domain-containing protein [Bacteroidales bacterium]